MLQHLKMLIDEGLIAISPKFDKQTKPTLPYAVTLVYTKHKCCLIEFMQSYKGKP
jgi:hypothetical protein